jgi:hypothetical protein
MTRAMLSAFFQPSVSRTLTSVRGNPSSELLGYYHSSAIADWALKDFLCKALQSTLFKGLLELGSKK